jgi:hypothetical protein
MTTEKTASTVVAHHVELYREDSAGVWGAQCLTCGYDAVGPDYTTADRLAAAHHAASAKPDPSTGASS